jgi:hypothetical protein
MSEAPRHWREQILGGGTSFGKVEGHAPDYIIVTFRGNMWAISYIDRSATKLPNSQNTILYPNGNGYHATENPLQQPLASHREVEISGCDNGNSQKPDTRGVLFEAEAIKTTSS